jgi:hypothetical protein
VDTSTRVDTVIDRPVVALAAIGERARDLFEAWVQREVVSDRVLLESLALRNFRGPLQHAFHPGGAVLKYGNRLASAK